MNHNLMLAKQDGVYEPLFVIAPLFNPQRYRTRWKLYQEFENYMLANPDVVLVTIECSFKNREFVTVEKDEPNHKVFHVTADDEIWIKENLINLAIQRLPKDAEYIAWIDADVSFARPDWAEETIHQLQHYDVVQMFSTCHDLTTDFNPYQINQGFVYNHLKGSSPKDGYSKQKRNIVKSHPGYAWASKKSVLTKLGGLIDFAILGSADNYMAKALIGKAQEVVNDGFSTEYKAWIFEWEQRALQTVKSNIGYVDGLLLHYFHGKKEYRKYYDRWKILIDTDFQPTKDLVRNWQGVYSLSGNNHKLRDLCRAYFRQRNEDCIHLEENAKFL